MLKLAKKRLGTMIVVGFLLGAISFFGLIVTQKPYRASSDLLVVQNQNGFSDYYALSKSADYLAGVLVESIYSEKFLEEMDNTKIVSMDFLPQDKVARLKEWNKIIKINKNSNVGILNIEVFGNSQKQVMDISNTVLTVLTTKSFLFLGQGQDIDMRILSGPLFEKNPSVINLVLAGVGGFAVGILLMLLWTFLQVEFGVYRNIQPFHNLHRNLSPEEETEKNAMEYWNQRMNGK